MIYIYLILLIIAPQLWWKPILNLPADYYIYPFWLAGLFFNGGIFRFFQFSKINYLFVGMIVWIIISSYVNPQSSYTTKIIFDYIKFFILFQLVSTSVSDFSVFRRVIWFFLFLVFILAVESIDHKFAVDGLGWVGQPLGWADDAVIKTSGSGRTQWINIFDGPGVFCVLFTMALPFVVQHFDRHYSTVVKIFYFAGFLLLSTAIYFTGSRGGFLASLACLFAYVLSRRKLSLKQLIVASLISFLLFMMAPAFLTSTHDSEHSAENRVDVWKEGLEMVKYNPVFGIGKGNYASYTGSLIAHNSAIEVMGETGLPGFFLWLSLIFLSFKSLRCFYVSTNDLNERSYAVALAISIIGYLTSSMFVTLEYETFYFLLALAAALGKISGKEVTFNRKDAYLIIGIMVGWIVLLKGFFMIY